MATACGDSEETGREQGSMLAKGLWAWRSHSCGLRFIFAVVEMEPSRASHQVPTTELCHSSGALGSLGAWVPWAALPPSSALLFSKCALLRASHYCTR